MPPGDARIIRLEDRLLAGGLPLHLPLAAWPERAVLRLEANPALLANATTPELERLEALCEDALRAGGIDPGTIRPADLSSLGSPGIGVNLHGRDPLALECGCGPCKRFREGRP